MMPFDEERMQGGKARFSKDDLQGKKRTTWLTRTGGKRKKRWEGRKEMLSRPKEEKLHIGQLGRGGSSHRKRKKGKIPKRNLQGRGGGHQGDDAGKGTVFPEEGKTTGGGPWTEQGTLGTKERATPNGIRPSSIRNFSN